MRRLIRTLTLLAVTATASGCALYSDVSIAPLVVLPTKIDRGSDVHAMVRKADFLRAIEMAETIENRQRRSAADLIALGYAEMAAARYEPARRHLRAALELNPPRNSYAEAAWHLSQIDYMTNNFATSLEWAGLAMKNGVSIVQWHIDYLTALKDVQIYAPGGASRDELPLRIGRPDVPRIDIRIGGRSEPVTAIIDSGAVMSIMSERLISTITHKILPGQSGTFYGLLGEPINVRFALVDQLHLGLITLHNVPVAVMPNEKMRFFVSGQKEFSMDFLLGANLLKEFRLVLDFSRNRLVLIRLSSLDKQPAADQNLYFENFRPVVRGTIQKRGWFVFVLDTGSEVTYLNESQLKSMPIDYFTPRVHSATLQGLGGAKKRGAKIENVEIGIDRWAGTFKTLPMYTGQENERAIGIIGENFLKKFLVVIDFGRMRVDLERR